ncbi:MAG: YdcF family protein [Alphaproteobacteria bacterium]|nr:YdcF family protein [Alphaproteobacteria bacterium]
MFNLKSIISISIAFILYIISFLDFIKDLEKENINSIDSNTIVVLTGNTGRLNAAIDLMLLNTDTRLFITGVARGVRYSEIIKNKKIDKARIILGYKAQSTLGNAIETKIWIQKNNFKDFILITDDWHMQRSLVLFKNSMPNIKIIPYRLKSNSNLRKNFYFEEHLKYLISHIQVIYLWIIN